MLRKIWSSNVGTLCCLQLASAAKDFLSLSPPRSMITYQACRTPTESKSNIHHVETHLESKTNQAEHKTENIQFKCQGCVTLRIRDMTKYTEYTKRNTDIHQQKTAQNLTPEVVRQGTQHYTLEMNQITTHTK